MGHPTQVRELLRLEKEKIREINTPGGQDIEKGHGFCYDHPIIPRIGSEEDWERSWEDALKLNGKGQWRFHSGSRKRRLG